jgi:hypothetical protein
MLNLLFRGLNKISSLFLGAGKFMDSFKNAVERLEPKQESNGNLNEN